MSRKVVIITLLLLAAAFRTVAQEDETEEDDLFHHTIDSAMAISPLYLPTSYTELGTIFFKPVDYKVIDTTINRIAQHDPLEQTINLCQTLGIIGQAHKFINFSYEKEPGFALFTFPFPLYFKEQEDLEYYNLKTVYTNLGFTYSVIPKQYMLTATHTQNIRDKVKYAINLRGLASNGYYTNQRILHQPADQQHRGRCTHPLRNPLADIRFPGKLHRQLLQPAGKRRTAKHGGFRQAGLS